MMSPTTSIYTEPEKQIPVQPAHDVIVCGGGPAGVCAAISAARAGAKTLLFDVQGCLGGTWTAGYIAWVIDAGNKRGTVAEIGDKLGRRNARRYRQPGGSSYAFDVEAMKLLLEEMCLEAGVELQYHTRVVDAVRQSRRLAMVVTESKSGRQAWPARMVIDATGDGDVGALAGCGFDVGDPDTGKTQPMSLLAAVMGIRFDDIEPFVGGGSGKPKQRLLQLLRTVGVEPSYGGPTLFCVRDDFFWLMANHQYGVSGLSAADVTRATIQGRREVHEQIAALRSVGGPWKDIQLVATSEHIGVREGRRIHGHAAISIDDLVAGRKPEDSVCTVHMGIDVHSPDPKHGKGCNHGLKQRSKPYGVPYKALIAKDVDGLLLAGRCISGDFLAHSSYRVTGDAAAMGDAAGAAAALAASHNCLPQDLPWADVRSTLK